ncbi:hypothetical protein ADU37_CDS03000 [Thermococcus sp. 2319x1]|nr:hypothetical protein [Thermococcus sp. 2319x1]ALV61999.1 hypothetical protein ADU37_CDS03000 [Thermococcus sp. 2319x1]
MPQNITSHHGIGDSYNPKLPWPHGPGTKKALYEAMVNVSKKMNKDEQAPDYRAHHQHRWHKRAGG